MSKSLYVRMAAATGAVFVAMIAAAAIIGQVKDLNVPGDLALKASNEVFGTVTLLTGLGAIALIWFTGVFAGRLRQVEGGSGRLATVVAVSGAIIAAVLALSVSVMFTARSAGSPGIGRIATGFLDGPALFFPAAALVGAQALIGIRGTNVPRAAKWVSYLAAPLALWYIAGAGLMLFKNYAWINDVGYMTFLAYTLAVSAIGVMTWGEIDTPRTVEEPEVHAEVISHEEHRRKPQARARRVS